MPTFPQMQERANGSGLNFHREENNNLASSQGTWFQNSSPFNTPSPTGDSVESLSDLLNMPTARTGDHLPHLYQLRSCMEELPSMPGCQNFDYLPWSQNSSPFDNTPPPHGDSISDLLCLNMPRGNLIGNSNPLAPTSYDVTQAVDTNLSYQGAGVRYGNYQMRYDSPTVSVPQKILGTTDNQFTIPPICPPANSPPAKTTRSTPINITSNNNTSNESNCSTSLGEMSNVNFMGNTVSVQPNPVVCKANEHEWSNIQHLYTLQRQQQDCDPQLMNKIIERTGRLLLAAVHNDQTKNADNFEVYNNGKDEKQPRFQRNPDGTTASRDVFSTWFGDLPYKNHKQPVTYSCKVFVGGLPWDISEIALIQAFSKFGSVKVEWPKKDGVKDPKGFAYIVMESEKKVKTLLDNCTYNCLKSGDFFKIPARKMKSKEIQVEIIPWVVADSNFAKVSQKLDPYKTVFVGALHGMIHAEALAKIMSDLFGPVIYAGLDTDKYKYPIGSGRVTFCSHNSYMKAILAAFIEVKTPKFSKKVQINPYLEDSPCSACSVQQGPYFCREITCFRYFCKGCWKWQHSNESMRTHRHLTRGSKTKSIPGSAYTPQRMWE